MGQPLLRAPGFCGEAGPVRDWAAQAKRAVSPALQGIWAPPSSAPPLVPGLANPTVDM